MKQYQKIQTVYFRDPNNNYKTLIEGIPGKDYKFTYLNDLKYVHELQNLFFALTGTELQTVF